MEQKPSYNTFIAYCTYLRKAFTIKGILTYSEQASQKIKVIGKPFPWTNAVNDNEVKL